jgi:hypothetical protein
MKKDFSLELTIQMHRASFSNSGLAATVASGDDDGMAAGYSLSEGVLFES